ncbi:MAG TPA: hypothetical protein VGU63_07575 [Candidatus Acidoferrales bacterium]|nr:hypothetical protein [Candidatus Acidoferrales bacterium]
MANNPFEIFPPLVPLPGIMASTAEEFPQNLVAANQQVNSACACRDWLGQCQSPALCSGQQSPASFPGAGMVKGVVTGAKAVSGLVAFFSDPARMATFILGFLLIAAGLFSHPAVREKIARAGKAAGEAAALVA